MRYFAAVTMVLAFAARPVVGAEVPDALPVDQAFELLKTYDYGELDQPLRVIELHVGRFADNAAHKAQIAERLAAYLADPKNSRAVKVFVCQQLLVVGTEAQVPLLTKLLDDPQTVEIARFTLDAIPGEASLAAIRGAAARLQGLPLVGALNSLGLRRDTQAVALLTKHIASGDPQVAAAAAESLGKIATPEAAAGLIKAEVPAQALAALHNAQLQCAERRAAAGDPATAMAMYRQVWSAQRPLPWRLAGLRGLVRVAPDQATPFVLATLASDDPFAQATALRLTRDLPGQPVTAALLQQLDKLDPAGQASLLSVLGERGDRSALDAAVSRLDDKDEALRVAAIQALARLGNATLIERLAKLAATASGAPQQAARLSLVRLAGADIEPKLFALAAAGEPAERIEILRALAARRSHPAAPVLLKAAADADPQVRAAAFDALAVVAQAGSYGQLVTLLASATAPADAEAAELAVLATGGRIEDPAARLAPLTAALPGVPTQVKPSFLRVLSGFGGVEALAAVRPYLADSEVALRDAAVRAVAKWPDISAAGDLLKIAQSSDNATQRLLSVRGYLRLVGTVQEEDVRLKMLEQVRPIATTASSKRLLLGVLTEAADPGALHVTSSFLDDADVAAEAAAATLKIANALVRSDAPAVRAAMKKLMDTTKDQALADQAAALDEEAQKAPSPGAGQAALQRDQKRSDAQKAALGKRPPPGYHLACYLDCGPDTADGVKGGPLLRHVSGATYFWAASDQVADARFGSVFFDSARVAFEARGLNPKKSYQIGFTWWDFDHGTRVQSVWAATAKGERETKLLDKTPLPSAMNKQGPDGKTLPVPAELVADGALRITFRNEATPNVVVSEVWLWESDAEVQAKPNSAGPQTAAAAIRPNVLLVTGQELHDWKKTAPVLVELLQQDPRLHVRVVEDPSFLADASIHQYEAIVLHFMNWQVPAPGPEARQNFQKYVEGGKGVCLVHFACGAWQDWPEFRQVVGRAWDPKLRAHDPRGPFRVTFTEIQHPISAGLPPFEADDELYTCLAGDRPIEVLAIARSKVDKQDYPMAFVLPSGKGRVFQCLLGHDVKALQMPGVGELYRRGCAWAAGLPPK